MEATTPKRLRRFNLFRGKRRIFTICIVASFVLIGAIIYIVYSHNKSTPRKGYTEGHISSPGEVENLSKSLDQQRLSSKDYDSYQIVQRGIATQYIGLKDYNNAKRILDSVVKKVPADHINSDTYATLAIIARDQNDIKSYKDYIPKIIERLKIEGNNIEADAWSKELSK